MVFEDDHEDNEIFKGASGAPVHDSMFALRPSSCVRGAERQANWCLTIAMPINTKKMSITNTVVGGDAFVSSTTLSVVAAVKVAHLETRVY
jgi:hypothetical protein